MLDFEEELKLEFLNEADDAVQEGERIIIALERDDDKTNAIAELFRVMHNFKGSSAGAGFADLAAITHVAESLLIKLKTKQLNLTPAFVSLLLRCNDHLTASIPKLRADLKADVSNKILLSELEKALEQGQESNNAEVNGSFDVNANQVENMSHPTESAPSHDSMPEKLSELVGQIVHDHHPEKYTKPTAKQSSKNAAESIRVPLPKIEQLLNDMGELVILQTVMNQNRKALTSPFLRKTVLQMEKLVRSVQSNSMSLRMLSLKQLFQKLERIVRDTSVTLGKEIEFKTKGEENEIDKTMLEQISDPLVHVIRNSVDHGIESAEDRIRQGKPAVGKIQLSAFQQGDQMVIEVSDDGKGLDPEHIRASAVKKGLIPADLKMSDSEARKLIFLPGFSTKSEVSDISGRGVGMDVVQTNVTELQGRIELHSEVGKGTTLQIFLPLTLAIIEGVIVQISDQRFVVPLSNILEYHHPRLDSLTTISERGEVLLIRGESIPILRMDRVMRIQRKKDDGVSNPFCTVIIVDGHRHGKVALMVDRIVRQQQIVIKQLSGELQGHPGIMGGAVLGDGRVAMILDIFSWIEKSLHSHQTDKKNPNLRLGVG